MINKGALCAGIAVVDSVVRPFVASPKMGTVALVEEIGLYPGGNPVNTSIDMARLGSPVAIAVAVGRDGMGKFLIDQLSLSGVDTRPMFVSNKFSTGASVALVRHDGERGFIHTPGANKIFSDRHIPDTILKRNKWLHLSGFFLMPALDGTPSSRCLMRATKLGLTTSLDVCWDPSGKWRGIFGVLRHVDWFMPSYGEAVAIFKVKNPDQIAVEAFRLGVRRGIILKMGSTGSRIYLADGTRGIVPPLKVKAVDATGAGDAYNAGFISASLRGLGPLDSARYGSVTGALAVSGMGGAGNIRSWGQVRALAGRVRVVATSVKRVRV